MKDWSEWPALGRPGTRGLKIKCCHEQRMWNLSVENHTPTPSTSVLASGLGTKIGQRGQNTGVSEHWRGTPGSVKT